MASKPCCDAGQPILAHYDRKGAMVEVAGTQMYKIGDSEKAIVVIPDIFGLAYNQVFQVADRLSDGGFTVMVPDVFHGQPWPKAKFPPKPEDHFMDWIHEKGSWEAVSKDIYKAVDYLKSEGKKKFGIVGFCWGVSIACIAAADPTFSASGGAHPTFFGKDKEIAEKIQCPVILLPTEGDPMETVKEVLDDKPFGDRCVYTRKFNPQVHGFCAARGDWEKPEVAEAATEAVGMMVKFFQDNV